MFRITDDGLFKENPRMMLVRTYLANSDISGIGVFASSDIPKGTVVWRFDEDFDRVIPKEKIADWPEHFQEYVRHYAYPHPARPGCLIVEVDNGRFVNHSEAPNVDYSSVFHGYAKRLIRAGEELTANYADFDMEYDPAIVFDHAQGFPVALRKPAHAGVLDAAAKTPRNGRARRAG